MLNETDTAEEELNEIHEKGSEKEELLQNMLENKKRLVGSKIADEVNANADSEKKRKRKRKLLTDAQILAAGLQPKEKNQNTRKGKENKSFKS